MRAHPFAVGDLVKARPVLRAPKDPKHLRTFIWPYFFPARITDLIGDDGAVVEFCAFTGTDRLEPAITPWPKTAGYSVSDLHEIDCTCTRCEPDAHLADPRRTIERLTGDLEGIGPRRALRTGHLLAQAGFAGQLHMLHAPSLARGDFLLFPHQHLHTVTETRGDIRLRACAGEVIVGHRSLHLVFRPERPTPVCDRASPHYEPMLAPAHETGELSLLEAAVATSLTDLGLTEVAEGTPVNAAH